MPSSQSPDPANIVAPHPDTASVDTEMCATWKRHGVLLDGERIDGYVAMLSIVGYDSDDFEYRRAVKMVAPSGTRGETRRLLREGLDMLPTARDAATQAD